MTCMTWPPFTYSSFGRDHVWKMTKNDTWAIRVRYKWKFDAVLYSQRRIQSPEMTINAIETLFVCRGHHLLIQFLDVTMYGRWRKMIRGRFGCGLLKRLTLFFIVCVVYKLNPKTVVYVELSNQINKCWATAALRPSWKNTKNGTMQS